MSDKPSLKSPAIDPQTVVAAVGSNYPDAFKPRVAGRAKRKLGDALGQTFVVDNRGAIAKFTPDSETEGDDQ